MALKGVKWKMKHNFAILPIKRRLDTDVCNENDFCYSLYPLGFILLTLSLHCIRINPRVHIMFCDLA